MKKILFSLVMMIAAIIPAQAMTFSQAQEEALYLSDKMAYELNLSSAQYDAVYEINLDYFTAIAAEGDIFGVYWERRNEDLSYVLSSYQYREYLRLEYFYRPVYWQNGFIFRIYTHYADRHKFFFARPSHYATYRGGHAWHHNGNHSYYKGRTFDRNNAIRNYGSAPSRSTVHRSSAARRTAQQQRRTAQQQQRVAQQQSQVARQQSQVARQQSQVARQQQRTAGQQSRNAQVNKQTRQGNRQATQQSKTQSSRSKSAGGRR